MVWYEKGYSGLRVEMFGMLTGESETLEAFWNPSSFAYFKIEVGTHHYGFRSWFTSYSN